MTGMITQYQRVLKSNPHCLFKCDYTGKPNYHHIVPSALCGPNDGWNIIPLCPNHHALFHETYPLKFISSLLEKNEEEMWTEAWPQYASCPDLESCTCENNNCMEKVELHTTQWRLTMEAYEGRNRGKQIWLSDDPEYCCVWWTAMELLKDFKSRFLKDEKFEHKGEA